MATDKTDNSAQEAILEALNKMAKAVKGGTDAQKEGNKISKKTLTSSEGVIKGLGVAKGLITKMLTVQGDLNRAFLGFGRNLDSSLGSFTKDLMGATTTMAEDMKAVTGVFGVGIKQNVAHTVKLNHSLLVLGKDTSKWNKTIAAQNQVYRQNAKHTGSLVEAMIDNTLRAKLDTDKLATAITGLSTTMDNLAVTMGAGVPMMAVKAIENMQNELGNQSFTDMATKVLSFYLSSANSDKLLKLTGGKMNLTSVGGFEDLIRVLGRESLRAFNAGHNLGGGFLQHYAGPKFAGAMGATPQAALMGGMIANPIPGDHTTGKGLSELARQAAQNDILRTMSILFKNLSVAMVPMITSITQMVNANVVPQLHNAMSRLAVKTASIASWIQNKIGGGGNPALDAMNNINSGGGGAGNGTQQIFGPQTIQSMNNMTAEGEGNPGLMSAFGTLNSYDAGLAGSQMFRAMIQGKSMLGNATGLPATWRVAGEAVNKLKGSMINRFNIGKMFTTKGAGGKGAVKILDSRLAKVLGEGIEKGAILSMEAFTTALGKSGYGRIISEQVLLQAGFNKSKTGRGFLPKLLAQLAQKTGWKAAAAQSGKVAATKIAGAKALGVAGIALDVLTVAELAHAGYKYFNPDTMFEMDQASKGLNQTVGAGLALDSHSEQDVLNAAQLIAEYTGDNFDDVREMIMLQYKQTKIRMGIKPLTDEQAAAIDTYERPTGAFRMR